MTGTQRVAIVTGAAGGGLAGDGAGPVGGGHPQSRRAGKGKRGRSLRQSLTGFFWPARKRWWQIPTLKGLSLPTGPSLSALLRRCPPEADRGRLDGLFSRGDRSL